MVGLPVSRLIPSNSVDRAILSISSIMAVMSLMIACRDVPERESFRETACC